MDKRRVIWKDVDKSELEDYPKLNITELRDLTFGVYQIKQAQSYMTEHLDDVGDYKTLVHREHQGLIKAQSRPGTHRRSFTVCRWNYANFYTKALSFNSNSTFLSNGTVVP